ncbi:MAG TPA: MFS transporter [Baekduia sp.]|uniref:MFS transporter n=1 Tax=Baekduia sp. TaxID=2600305 RepID=UPI002D78BDB4|nr:MFS transporter [Baekduia sp.]HET6507624.1 MFS transporter [Baekduia sp.]
MSTVAGGQAYGGAPTHRSIWNRQLTRYPETAQRTVYLGITVLATVVLYYQLYVQGSVATKIIAHFGFTFTQFVFVLVIGNLVGAFASLGAGLADRWGRANLVVGGLLVVGLLTLFALPNASSKAEYTVFFALVSIVEGMALVATPALIRDFSPQIGRASAMAFWTMGPVLGSLAVTEVSSHTLVNHPDWQFQFRVAGIVGLVVFAVAAIGLRELSPALRDQLMVSIRDRALIEARAAGISEKRLAGNHWLQMLRPDIVLPALAISLFLLLYYIFVAFLVVYFATVFGYSAHRANALANWYWIANVCGLLAAGLLSDRIRVRKPVMIVGTGLSLIAAAIFASRATHPTTSYHTFAWVFVLGAVGGGTAYVAWMAAFTETVEKVNPAATATGLAVWGWIIRLVVTVSFALLPVVVPATSTLVDKGTRVSQIVATYPQQVQVLGVVDPATLTAAGAGNRGAQAKAITEISTKLNVPITTAAARLASVAKVPPADLAFLSANAAKVQKAQADNPGQWQTWWWICFAGQVCLIPATFLLTGRWSPRKAREDEAEHEAMVQRELAALQTART